MAAVIGPERPAETPGMCAGAYRQSRHGATSLPDRDPPVLLYPLVNPPY